VQVEQEIAKERPDLPIQRLQPVDGGELENRIGAFGA
jgi:hypothetical protein